jgi:tRNA(Ile)-lysidine synthase
MHSFLTELRSGLTRCRVAGSRVLVAVSGGADSVALLRGLSELSIEFGLELTVAHLNHQLRGVASDADANWVEALAASLKLRCDVGVVPADAFLSNNSGVEETARNLRYQFLENAATRGHCPTIAFAHTADDQSETVLHHLFRGTGIAGLRGIPESRLLPGGHRLVRPLLSVRRELIETYLQSLGQAYRTDETNSNTALMRNRFRHVLLPLLREQINPQVDGALSRLADQARDVEVILGQLAGRLLETCLKDQQADCAYLDVATIRDQPTHLVREMFRMLWDRQNWPRQAMSYAHWNRLAEIMTARKSIVFPGQIEAKFHSDSLLVIRRI